MSASTAPGIAARVRRALDGVVARTIVAIVTATAIVVLAFATGVAQRAAEHAAHGAAGIVGTHAQAVRSESEFVAAMIPHHEEAVASAALILALTEREEVRSLAADVVEAQSKEIAQLRAWLTGWYPDDDEVAYEPMMRPFTGLRPAEADHVFVADMIHHHEGAIAMADAYLALRGAKRPEVEALARDVIRSQRAEIAVLSLMLQMWGVAPADHSGH